MWFYDYCAKAGLEPLRVIAWGTMDASLFLGILGYGLKDPGMIMGRVDLLKTGAEQIVYNAALTGRQIRLVTTTTPFYRK